MDLSIVIALLNEEESLPELVSWIDRVVKEANLITELIMIDDGSTDTSWQVIQELKKEYTYIKGIKFRRNYGKSAALNVGFEKASGDVVLTMDADMQDSPDEIPELYAIIKHEQYDIVSGWKQKRHDPIGKTLPSKFFNMVTRKFSGIKLHDFNCGLKAYNQEVVKNIEIYGDMHRYIPVIAKMNGFHKITEKVVEHRARKYGVSKFGVGRMMYGFLDLTTVLFLGKFGKRPMHFFGTWGIFFMFIGFMILLYLTIVKMIYHTGGIATRPLFFFGILTLIIGTQLFVTGYVAELVSRNAVDRNNYKIAEEIN
jgi:glycosyltransferase involved in cell wall biosynthesis